MQGGSGVGGLVACEIKDFLCTYLGPLAILVDKGADNLPKWKRWEASLINHAGQFITISGGLVFHPRLPHDWHGPA
jgi:hypothetical protein